MDCYVCHTPRPEGANYCPGCGRYCADDPNVPKTPLLPAEDIILEEPSPIAEPIQEPVTAPVQSPEAEQVLPVSEVPEPTGLPRKRRRKHHPVLIPVLSMVCLFFAGTLCWFLLPYDHSGPPDPGGSTAQTDGATEPAKQPTRPSHRNDPLESYTPTDEACFRMENGVVSFLPENHDGSPILVIPAEVNGQTVTGIAPGGFSDLENVTTLVLPETLETIGDSAFANCLKLRGVYIPDSVKSIGSSAFSGCIDMESVSIPVGTTSIGADAFDCCASLMYFFYEGTYDQWMELYNEYVTPFTYACCADGDYYHGAYTP